MCNNTLLVITLSSEINGRHSCIHKGKARRVGHRASALVGAYYFTTIAGIARLVAL
jgi:hypothetical protein